MKYKEKQDLERMYAEGASATEIAIALGLSANTVRSIPHTQTPHCERYSQV